MVAAAIPAFVTPISSALRAISAGGRASRPVGVKTASLTASTPARARATSSVDRIPIGRVDFGLDGYEMGDLVLAHQLGRMRERVAGLDEHDRRRGGSACGPVVELARGRRGDEVEVGDDSPELCSVDVFRLLAEDDDAVDPVEGHHPRHGWKRCLPRARDDARVHRVPDAHLCERERALAGLEHLLGHVNLLFGPLSLVPSLRASVARPPRTTGKPAGGTRSRRCREPCRERGSPAG